MAPDPHHTLSASSSTRATPIASDPASALVPGDEKQVSAAKKLARQYVTRDLVRASIVIEDKKRQKEDYVRRKQTVEDYADVRRIYQQYFPPSRLHGMGFRGYGNGHTDGPTRIIYPASKPRLGHRKTRRLRISRRDMAQQAEQEEMLVPVRLDVEYEMLKLRDTFTWNLHDRVTPTDVFAAQLVEDFGLALPQANPVLEQVHAQLREQLSDFFPPLHIDEGALDPELPYSAYKDDELRILIKLNITIGPTTLEDKFEWDINNPLNSPEEFAAVMSRDLSLAGEFTTAIAHCIREQSQLYTRSLYMVGHCFDGRPLEDADLVASFLPSPLPSAFRPQQQAREYGPLLYDLSEADQEKNEVILSREQRRQKRSVNRRGGPTLPDLKERQRTVRTLVISAVLPGAAEDVEASKLYKRAATGRHKRGHARDDLSDSSESDDSGEDSPVMSHLLAGTARTRGMRGAATAAQARMANMGRSETPEAVQAHHHETRTSARRTGVVVRTEREETADTFIIKLRINKERLRRWTRELKTARPASQPASLTRHSSGGTMGPPPSHHAPVAATSTAVAATTLTSAQLGSVDAPNPVPGQPAPRAVCP